MWCLSTLAYMCSYSTCVPTDSCRTLDSGSVCIATQHALLILLDASASSLPSSSPLRLRTRCICEVASDVAYCQRNREGEKAVTRLPSRAHGGLKESGRKLIDTGTESNYAPFRENRKNLRIREGGGSEREDGRTSYLDTRWSVQR